MLPAATLLLASPQPAHPAGSWLALSRWLLSLVTDEAGLQAAASLVGESRCHLRWSLSMHE